MARAINKWSQSPDRMRALQSLAEDGSPEALYGLLRRFGMMYDKTIDDEQEKDWVFEVLVEKGAVVLPSLKKYLSTADSITWPLRLLDKVVATKEEVIAVLEEVLARHEPGYERDPTKKIQLMNHLAEIKHPRVSPLVLPYLADMDEGVRCAAVDALIGQADGPASRLPLLEHFESDKEDSLRIRLRIADGFADLGWTLGDHRAAVEKRLPEAFMIEPRDPKAKDAASSRIKKKPAAKE
ncbi:MAG TPA: HEAT repeat domain-containing protein [Polyangia bacterium]|nr:HEAT repeat domain-containing protein [Polyangia bacterium]